MIAKEDTTYRQLVTLRDGARVLLRFLAPEDRQNLIDLFAPVNDDDLRYMRHNVRDAKLVGGWVDELDYDRVMPLLALVGERAVGNASLHFGAGPARHRAEVRIFLAKDFRRRGLGSKMIQTLVELARRRNLYVLEVDSPTDRTHDIKAFQNEGFQMKCVFEDYFMLPDGDLLDVARLVLRLRASEGQF